MTPTLAIQESADGKVIQEATHDYTRYHAYATWAMPFTAG